MSTPANDPFKGTGYKQVSIPNFSPEITSQLEKLLGGSLRGLGPLLQRLQGIAGGGDEATWKQLEAPALRQFGQLQGQIASRFAGGGTGGVKSSAFSNQLNSASTDLAERLQSQRMGYQNQAQGQLMQLAQMLLGTPLKDTYALEKEKPWWQDLFTSVGEGVGELGGAAGAAWLLGLL